MLILVKLKDSGLPTRVVCICMLANSSVPAIHMQVTARIVAAEMTGDLIAELVDNV